LYRVIDASVYLGNEASVKIWTIQSAMFILNYPTVIASALREAIPVVPFGFAQDKL